MAATMGPSSPLQDHFSDIAIIRWLHKRRRSLIAVAYLWFIAYSTLLPFDFQWALGRRNIAELNRPVYMPSFTTDRSDIVVNVLLYIPLGAAVSVAVHHRMRRWWAGAFVGCLLGMCLSATIEFLQLFSPSRVGSLRDIMANTAGTAIGCAAAPVIGGVLRLWRRKRRKAMAGQPAWHLARLASVALIACGLVPFDVRADLGQIRDGLRTAHFRPFWQLDPVSRSGESAPPGAAAFWIDFAGDAGAFALFGAAIAMATTAEGGFGTLLSAFIALWSGIGLAVIIEVSQILIASRGFDITDMIAEAGGTLVGAAVGVVIGGIAARRRWRWGGPVRLVATPVLVLALLGQVGYLLVLGLDPFRFGPFPRGEALWSAIGLVPFRGYTANLTPALIADFALKCARYAILGILLMMLLYRYVPAGARGFVRCLGISVLVSTLVSASIEIAQLWLPGRYCDISDVVIAGMGVLAAGIGVQWYLDAVKYARLRIRRGLEAAAGSSESPLAEST